MLRSVFQMLIFFLSWCVAKIPCRHSTVKLSNFEVNFSFIWFLRSFRTTIFLTTNTLLFHYVHDTNSKCMIFLHNIHIRCERRIRLWFILTQTTSACSSYVLSSLF
ncbi:hypothetical protein CRENBAI_017451 [Crenichthys baileyi]|uniref:Secreted protein n=1 Tax=Crenichthys baileyi TaxID=28760 RepID=A0AAV9QUN9_9TELE